MFLENNIIEDNKLDYLNILFLEKFTEMKINPRIL